MAAAPVIFVGAGPGAADYITVRGAHCLARADVVLHDALTDPALRSWAPQARWIHVGKRGYRDSTMQTEINALMVKHALAGKRVVRLKGGDPFVFGRGAEEALALAHAGIPCEVVPGVTTAVAAPELAGIPVTHRGVASGFLVLAGQTAEALEATLAAIRPHSVTLVSMMGLAHRGDFDELVIVAPPMVLGEMRKKLHSEVSDRVTAEVPKTLTTHVVADIDAILKAA